MAPGRRQALPLPRDDLSANTLDNPTPEPSGDRSHHPGDILQVPETQQTPSGAAKRAREDQLHDLELEKARLEVERQRKAIAWEEERQRKAIALEEERQRKAIAFEEDLYRQKLAQLAPPQGEGRRPTADEDDEGEIPPEAIEVSLLFPAVPQKEVAAIFEGKFDPKNLYKLHRKVTLTNEDEDEVSFIDGKLRTKKRTGTTKDYPQPSTWSRAFIQYVSILSEFEKFNGLTRPLLTFHERIMDLAQTYAWERVVVLALTFHKERLVLGIHDKKAWQIPSDVVDEHLRGALRPTKPTTNLPTEYCMKWNTGDCNWARCSRKHACRRCGKDHKEKDHKGPPS
ncbi:hypothetical protein V8E54_004747 [Elaphomyces granulatus]